VCGRLARPRRADRVTGCYRRSGGNAHKFHRRVPGDDALYARANADEAGSDNRNADDLERVTGTHTGSLTGNVTINKLTRVITPATASSQITSTLDGSTEVLLDPARLAASRAAV
jgi:hypothetical protein